MKSTNISLILIITILILISIDFPIEIRFQTTLFNYLFVLFLLVALLLLSYKKLSKVKSLFFKIFGFVIHLLFGIFILFFSLTSTYGVLKNKTDPSFEMIKEIVAGNRYFRLYRTNEGATTSYGLVLREEHNLPFGLKTIKIIFSKYKVYDATIKLISPNKLKINIKPYYKNQKSDKIIYKF